MTQTLKQDHSGSNPALSFGPNHLPLCTLVSSHKTWGIIISPSHRVSFRIEWISISKELKIIFAIYRAHTTSMYYIVFVNWNFKKVFWHCSLWPYAGYLQDILISPMVLLLFLLCHTACHFRKSTCFKRINHCCHLPVLYLCSQPDKNHKHNLFLSPCVILLINLDSVRPQWNFTWWYSLLLFI